MRRHTVILAGITALVTLAGVAWNDPVHAQQQSIVTRFSGILGTSGTWTRTIIDISEPNGPGGGTIQATYNVVVAYTVGMTDVQLANAYRIACNSTLPSPVNNGNGYGTAFNHGNPKHIRLSKQKGTFNYTDSGLPSTCSQPGLGYRASSTLVDCMIVQTTLPTNAEDAPAASPAGLASLVAGLSALAWWARRRKTAA